MSSSKSVLFLETLCVIYLRNDVPKRVVRDALLDACRTADATVASQTPYSFVVHPSAIDAAVVLRIGVDEDGATVIVGDMSDIGACCTFHKHKSHSLSTQLSLRQTTLHRCYWAICLH